MKFRIRKPRLRVSKSGKPSLSGGGISFGGKGGRVNLSKSGLSATVGGKGASYNTKRGWNCGFIALLVIGASIAATAGVVGLVFA
jgi:hypothetical protein